MTASSHRTLPCGRIEGLDAWRAGLMIGGIFLHAANWQEPRPLFDAIALVSHAFRMGAFFAISGFLAARALAGRSGAAWLRRRTVQICAPAIFGFLVLCPLISVIVAHIPGQPPSAGLNWYHLWFLVALAVYAPLGVLADMLDRRTGSWKILRGYDGAGHGSLMPLLVGMGLFSTLLLLLSALLIGTIVAPEATPMLFGWRSIVGYWPDYLLGFAVARSIRMQAIALSDWRSPTLMLGVVALAYLLWFGLVAPLCSVDMRLLGNGLLPLLGTAFAPPACFALILRSSAEIRRIAPPLRRLADASFTIYLVHIPVIAALSFAVAWSGWNPYLKFFVIVGATMLVSFAFHALVVKRSAWMSLLFCGHLPKRPSPSAAAAGMPGTSDGHAGAPEPETYAEHARPMTPDPVPGLVT